MPSAENKSRIYVYIAELPKNEPAGSVYPEERSREIEGTKNGERRREKYFVWRLLEYAISESLGISIGKLRFEKRGGIWRADGIEFSLSHSGGALAVAVSYAPVGVDIEPICGSNRGGVAERFLCRDELRDYLTAAPSEREERFLRIWTAKEAIFKSRGEETFCPSEVDSSAETVYTEALTVGASRYVLSVFAACPFEVTVIPASDLS